MPAQSQAQFKAMQAAAHGHSTLGIPKSVGQEFAAATPSPKRLPKRATSSLEAATGMAKGGTRHGGKPHKKGGKPATVAQHVAAINQHHASGNHGALKSAALNLANALHQQMPSGPMGTTTPGSQQPPSPPTPSTPQVL